MSVRLRISRCSVSILVMALLVAGTGAGSVRAARGQELPGGTYASPQFGYSISWVSPWLITGESSDTLDVLRLTNGLSNVVLLGGEAEAGSAQRAATLFANGIGQLEGVSDFAILDSGGDDTRFHLTASMTMGRPDGISEPVLEYIEARTLIPGLSVVIFDGYAPAELYARAKFEFDLLLATLVIPGAAVTAERAAPLQCTRVQANPVVQSAGADRAGRPSAVRCAPARRD